jgi:pyruvate/2-oxoglutarate dehydrogenase complex dihydrolipoamide acyltransferase (E2) component
MDVILPKWGMTMQEGTLSAWLVNVGDELEEGDAIATVETEKVDTELEAPASGVLEEILVEAGSTVEVGAVLARIRSD